MELEENLQSSAHRPALEDAAGVAGAHQRDVAGASEVDVEDLEEVVVVETAEAEVDLEVVAVAKLDLKLPQKKKVFFVLDVFFLNAILFSHFRLNKIINFA